MLHGYMKHVMNFQYFTVALGLDSRVSQEPVECGECIETLRETIVTFTVG